MKKAERGLGGAAFGLAWSGWVTQQFAPNSFNRFTLSHPPAKVLKQSSLCDFFSHHVVKRNRFFHKIEDEDVCEGSSWRASGLREPKDQVLGFD